LAATLTYGIWNISWEIMLFVAGPTLAQTDVAHWQVVDTASAGDLPVVEEKTHDILRRGYLVPEGLESIVPMMILTASRRGMWRISSPVMEMIFGHEAKSRKLEGD
jgi:hypothetical protein